MESAANALALISAEHNIESVKKLVLVFMALALMVLVLVFEQRREAARVFQFIDGERQESQQGRTSRQH